MHTNKAVILIMNSIYALDFRDILYDFDILSFFWFSVMICHIHWFYTCRSYKQSNWLRHKLIHTENT